jgi:hypothetical protein
MEANSRSRPEGRATRRPTAGSVVGPRARAWALYQWAIQLTGGDERAAFDLLRRRLEGDLLDGAGPDRHRGVWRSWLLLADAALGAGASPDDRRAWIVERMGNRGNLDRRREPAGADVEPLRLRLSAVDALREGARPMLARARDRLARAAARRTPG